MLGFAIQDVAIALAIKNDSLKIIERMSRIFNEPYWSIEDDNGMIEVAMTLDEAEIRVQNIKEKMERK